MKMDKLILAFVCILMISFSGCDYTISKKSDQSSESNNTQPTAPISKCKPSTSKVRSLVASNWNTIQRKASFTISEKGSFEVENYGVDGDELTVDVYSRGFMYDISFTVSFYASFDNDCRLRGSVVDVYNYSKY